MCVCVCVLESRAVETMGFWNVFPLSILLPYKYLNNIHTYIDNAKLFERTEHSGSR